jgi:hypothetical protein
VTCENKDQVEWALYCLKCALMGEPYERIMGPIRRRSHKGVERGHEPEEEEYHDGF